MSNNLIDATDLVVGKSYTYFNRVDRKEINMGKLLEKGTFNESATNPSAIFKFENGTKKYDWDETFKENMSGGKRKSRRNQKSNKSRRSKSRKNRRKSNRRR